MRGLKARGLMSAVVLVSAVALAACGDSSDSSSTASGADTAAAGTGLSASKAPIKIAAVKGFTGLLAGFDGPPTVAAQFAIDDINKAGGIGGRQVELIKVDTKTKVENGGPALLQAKQQGASFIIAPCDFDFGAPVAIAAQAAGIPAMSDCAGAPAFGKQGIGDLAFTMGMAGPSEGAALAEWAFKTKKLRSAYILRDTTLEYHKQVCKAFQDRWKALGGKIAGADTFKNDDPSVASQIGRLQGSSADTAMFCSFPPGGASALRQIRAAGVDMPILASNSFDGETWKKAVPKASNFYYTNYGALGGDDPRPEFNESSSATRPRRASCRPTRTS